MTTVIKNVNVGGGAVGEGSKKPKNVLTYYMNGPLGANRQVDHFVTLTGVWFSMCVLPLFYFMACASFRRDLETHGFAKALWNSVFKNYSEITPID